VTLAAASSTPHSHGQPVRAAARINDDAVTLEALMRAFVECRIKPYYLHHGDLAPGTAHLRTTLAEGQALDAGAAGARFRPVPAGLRAGYPRRLRKRRSGRNICRRNIPYLGQIIHPGQVNRSRKIALSYRRLLRRRAPLSSGAVRLATMTGEGEPPEEQGNRNVENAVLLGFFIVLVRPGSGCSHHGGCPPRCRTARRRAGAIAERSRYRSVRDERHSERWEKCDAKMDDGQSDRCGGFPVLLGGPAALRRTATHRQFNDVRNASVRAAARSRRRSTFASPAPATCRRRRASQTRRQDAPSTADQEHLPRLLNIHESSS